jgi:hypothetical protein
VLAVPAYTRVDAGLEYRLAKGLISAITAQNLLAGEHSEFASTSVFLVSRMPRRLRIELKWQF